MERKIAYYRGIATDNGKFTYGTPDIRAVLCVIRDGYIYTSIKPETLTPFTGKLDKKGKLIFEGDILRYYFQKRKKEEAGVAYEDFLVQWDEEQAGFCISSAKNPYEDGLSGSEEFEVVGNVFLNPELAEQFKNVRKTV